MHTASKQHHGALINRKGENGRSLGRSGGQQRNHVAKRNQSWQPHTVGTHSVLRDNIWSGSNREETESRMLDTLVLVVQESPCRKVEGRQEKMLMWGP